MLKIILENDDIVFNKVKKEFDNKTKQYERKQKAKDIWGDQLDTIRGV